MRKKEDDEREKSRRARRDRFARCPRLTIVLKKMHQQKPQLVGRLFSLGGLSIGRRSGREKPGEQQKKREQEEEGGKGEQKKDKDMKRRRAGERSGEERRRMRTRHKNITRGGGRGGGGGGGGTVTRAARQARHSSRQEGKLKTLREVM